MITISAGLQTMHRLGPYKDINHPNLFVISLSWDNFQNMFSSSTCSFPSDSSSVKATGMGTISPPPIVWKAARGGHPSGSLKALLLISPRNHQGSTRFPGISSFLPRRKWWEPFRGTLAKLPQKRELLPFSVVMCTSHLHLERLEVAFSRRH